MAVLLTIAAALVASSAARYEGNRLLQQYFWEDDLWDTVYQNGIFMQKCMNGDRLCLCRANGRYAHAFLCDHHGEHRLSAVSSAKGNTLNNLYIDQQAADYYFPATGAKGTVQTAIPEYPPNPTPKPKMGDDWADKSPWKVHPQLQDPDRVASTEDIKMARNHVISKATLKAFYKQLYTVIPDRTDLKLKQLLEPLFDEILKILVFIQYICICSYYSLRF